MGKSQGQTVEIFCPNILLLFWKFFKLGTVNASDSAIVANYWKIVARVLQIATIDSELLNLVVEKI